MLYLKKFTKKLSFSKSSKSLIVSVIYGVDVFKVFTFFKTTRLTAILLESVCENVKVYPKITSISIDKENVTFNEEEYVILNIEYTPENSLASSLNLEYKVNGE